ncbi:MTH538 TIR-like domain [Pseudonocardia ammonioxydans]|uniref:MTH538 TIR-like domain n=1 Tax=Pseudonocardia ammonioxydans TaxID=260086 RepID=A0A1I5GP21_PSUAM|nr:TIR domain-containing protein [Pseudonocardia ammonioxydans]SFO37660.1 MTH538 TIR-like domain [Pseudonocardia ammonioxydans]
MSDPRAFLSFDADNNQHEKTLFAGQCHSSSPTPFTVQDWSSKEPLPQAQWEELIKQKINTTNMLIVLVGRSMGSATGVHKEIAMAASQNVPIFGVYVNGAGPHSTLPPGLQRNRTMTWNWNDIGAAVKQMMTEGKNG